MAVNNVYLEMRVKGVQTVSDSMAAAEASIKRAAKAGADAGSEIADGAKRAGNSWATITGRIESTTGRLTDLYSGLQTLKQGFETAQRAIEVFAASERRFVTTSEFDKAFRFTADAVERLRDASGAAFNSDQLAQMANRANLLGLSFDQIEMAMRTAGGVAIKTGQSFENVYEAIIETAAGTVISADRFNELTGGTVDLRKAMDAFGAATNRTANDLSLMEQRTVSTATVFADLGARQKDLLVDYEGGKWTRFLNDASELWLAVGDGAVGYFEAIVNGVTQQDVYSKKVDDSSNSLLAFAYVIDQMTPGLHGQTQALRDQVRLMREWDAALKRIRDAHAQELTERAKMEKEGFNVLKVQEEALFDFYVKSDAERKKKSGGKSVSKQRAQEADDAAREQERLATLQAEAARRGYEQRISLVNAELDLRQLDLDESDRIGNAKLQLERDLWANESALRQDRISAEEGEVRDSIALKTYYLEERAAIADRQAELDEAQQRRMYDTISGLQMMDSAIGQIESRSGRRLMAINRIFRTMVLEMRNMVDGQAGAIASIGSVIGAAIENRRVQAGVLALFAAATAGLEFAQGNYPGAAAATAASLTYAAIAGGAGGGGSVASGGYGGAGAGGGFATPKPAALSLGGGGGQTTYITSGLAWSEDSAARLGEDLERARRHNLTRSRV